MPEAFSCKESVFDGQHNLGGTNFNLYRLDLEDEKGVTHTGIECWRPADKDPILQGENYIGTIEDAGRDRKKFKPDWRATNDLRKQGGGGSATPQPAPSQPQQALPPQPPQQVPDHGPPGKPAGSWQDKQDSTQASIEKQSAMKIAMTYARLMYDATGEVPSIEQITKWTAELNA